MIIGLDITNIIHYLNLPTGTYYFFINKKNTSIYDFFAGNQWSHYQQKLVKKIGLWIAINLKYVNAKTRGSASKKKKCKWMGSTQTIFRESSVQDLHRIFAVHLLKKSIFYWTDENKKYRKDCLPAV